MIQIESTKTKNNLIGVEKTFRGSYLFTILKSPFEIYIEYLDKNKEVFYSLFDGDDWIESGFDFINDAVERILYLMSKKKPKSNLLKKDDKKDSKPAKKKPGKKNK